VRFTLRVQQTCVLMVAASAIAWGQQGPPQGPQGPQGPRPMMMRHDAMGRGPHGPGGPGGPGGGMNFGMPGGKWWNNPEMVKRLGLTAEQQKRMDDVLQQSRLKLIDLTATLQKEEVMMESLMRGPQLDDAKILPSVDRIAEARAELEKANARMMLGLRKVLTPAQWDKLHAPPTPQVPQGQQPMQQRPGGNRPNPAPPAPREE